MKRKETNPAFKVGDVIGFSGRSWGSRLINIATYGLPGWGISHVGVIGEYHGKLFLFESLIEGNRGCLIVGGEIPGVQAHDIPRSVIGYEGRVWHYPLYRQLYDHEARRLNLTILSNIGKPYDEMGAMRSGGAGLSWVESLFRGEELASLFCSEFVAYEFATTGLYPIVNASRWNPNRLIRRLRRHRVLKKPVRLK